MSWRQKIRRVFMDARCERTRVKFAQSSASLSSLSLDIIYVSTTPNAGQREFFIVNEKMNDPNY